MSKKAQMEKSETAGGEYTEAELASSRIMAAEIVRSFQGTGVTVGEVFTALLCATIMLSDSVGDAPERCLKASAAAAGHTLAINAGVNADASCN